MKRNYRITISVNQEDWDAVHWLAWKDEATPATATYTLFADALSRAIGPGTKRGDEFSNDQARLRMAAQSIEKEVT